jgi:hypothetical protein
VEVYGRRKLELGYRKGYVRLPTTGDQHRKSQRRKPSLWPSFRRAGSPALPRSRPSQMPAHHVMRCPSRCGLLIRKARQVTSWLPVTPCAARHAMRCPSRCGLLIRKARQSRCGCPSRLALRSRHALLTRRCTHVTSCAAVTSCGSNTSTASRFVIPLSCCRPAAIAQPWKGTASSRADRAV